MLLLLKYVQAKNLLAKTPKDEKIRAVLWTPEIHVAVEQHFKMRHSRVRLAFDEYKETDPAFKTVDSACLEIYDVDGEPVATQKLTELDANISNAVQVELFLLLLAKKGCDIPSL